MKQSYRKYQNKSKKRVKKGGNCAGSASNYGAQVYGNSDQQGSRGVDNVIAMTGGNCAGSTSNYGAQVYGNSDQQGSRGVDNVIAMTGGSHIPLTPGQYPDDSLLNPSQSEIVVNNHTSAHSATDALSSTIKGGSQKGAGLTEMLVPVSLVALNEAIKKYMKTDASKSLKKGGNANMDSRLLSMMDENQKMMSQTQCQQAGYPAPISNAPYGSSIAVAAVDCNTTTGGGKKTKRKHQKKRKTNKKRGKKAKKN